MKEGLQNINLNTVNKINEIKDISEAKLLKTSTSNIFLSGSMSIIDDSEPELKNVVKRLTV